MQVVDRETARTLTIVRRPDRVLLGMKKRGFGAGRWNGFGGKIEAGETLVQAAHRELREEAMISATRLRRVGQLAFTFEPPAAGISALTIYLFVTDTFSGEPQETEEMRPHWFGLAEIPYDDMWPDTRHWLPLLLAGKRCAGVFVFRDTDTMVRHQVREVATGPASWHG